MKGLGIDGVIAKIKSETYVVCPFPLSFGLAGALAGADFLAVGFAGLLAATLTAGFVLAGAAATGFFSDAGVTTFGTTGTAALGGGATANSLFGCVATGFGVADITGLVTGADLTGATATDWFFFAGSAGAGVISFIIGIFSGTCARGFSTTFTSSETIGYGGGVITVGDFSVERGWAAVAAGLPSCDSDWCHVGRMPERFRRRASDRTASTAEETRLVSWWRIAFVSAKAEYGPEGPLSPARSSVSLLLVEEIRWPAWQQRA